VAELQRGRQFPLVASPPNLEPDRGAHKGSLADG
jgi:hypothetical protein